MSIYRSNKTLRDIEYTVLITRLKSLVIFKDVVQLIIFYICSSQIIIISLSLVNLRDTGDLYGR